MKDWFRAISRYKVKCCETMGNITVVTGGWGREREHKCQSSVHSSGVGECFAPGRKCTLTEATPFLSRTEEKTDLLSYGVVPEGRFC